MRVAAGLPAGFPEDLAGWLSHLEGLHPKGQAGIELGLERVRRVSEALGQRPFCPVITVTGTNGKGSTVVYLESILSMAEAPSTSSAYDFQFRKVPSG